MSETEAPLAPDPAEAAREGGPQEHDETIVEILAAKILIDWLRNRQQLLVPFSIDLQKVDDRAASLLVEAMLAAAQADGTVDGKERERVDSALALVNAGEAQRAMIDRVIEQPRALAAILAQVGDVQSAALFYAASLLAVDRRKLVNREYLRYLAARLQLPKELARSLEQRYRAASAG
jgi:uncharacterized membrane protein YebE (DUF533 family)